MSPLPVSFLAIANIPLFLFIAWLIFDTKESAAETIWDTVVAILQIILIPKIVRVLFDMDDTNRLASCQSWPFFLPAEQLSLGSFIY